MPFATPSCPANPMAPPVLLADVLDNYGGGGSSDTTWILAELVRQQAANAAAGVFWDADAAKAAHAAGLGARVTLDLGGNSGVLGDRPFRAEYGVDALSEGDFIGGGRYFAGGRLHLGPMAVLRLGGVRVVVSSQGEQAAEPAMFTHLGIDPAALSILSLKSSVHYRADFQPLAAEILEVAAPTPEAARLELRDYRNLRPGLRIRPGGPAFVR